MSRNSPTTLSLAFKLAWLLFVIVPVPVCWLNHRLLLIFERQRR